MTDSITITRPDDWHLHLRDGDVLPHTVAHTARQFARAIVMPNLVPPVTRVTEAAAYRQRILDCRPEGSRFEPLMTLYLTDRTSPEEIRQAGKGHVVAAKLYPAGATTNSDRGVTNVANIHAVLETMADAGMPLLVHGEVTHSDVDIFDREKRFIDEVLSPLTVRFPQLRLVLEHITTAEAASFVQQAPANVAATITPQHLLFNRNHMLVGGIKPHYYCLPILKRSDHQHALIEAAISGNPKFFLGTDSAPHATNTKENACGCAGCFTANAALELYAEAFEQAGAIERLEGFASHFGPDFYGLPRNSGTVTLRREAWTVPDHYAFGSRQITPLYHGQTLHWSLQTS